MNVLIETKDRTTTKPSEKEMLSTDPQLWSWQMHSGHFDADDDSDAAVLTGRPVSLGRGLCHGLANRVVEDGTSSQEAFYLALGLVKFPQTCLRHDRLSA